MTSGNASRMAAGRDNTSISITADCLHAHAPHALRPRTVTFTSGGQAVTAITTYWSKVSAKSVPTSCNPASSSRAPAAGVRLAPGLGSYWLAKGRTCHACMSGALSRYNRDRSRA